ncbi:response regulator transcription factor [Paenibacillus piri]|uniref:Response regulator n=1 Tax=Paenibacillus piri TaxID=2547395 RepID=A0A4R5K7P6_9BACL|nr:response regulator [Paenibacillus piri]TDF90514.1 response regulator [Paenibacillus piri]
MPNVIIADDEIWVRKGIIKAIDWELHGLRLIGEAADGEDAYGLILKNSPDILLLDMRMPGMDGRELLRLMKERFPDVLSIVISGYSDFEYTREAIQHGAFDYVLKPVKKPELMQALERVVDELNHRNGMDGKEGKAPDAAETGTGDNGAAASCKAGSRQSNIVENIVMDMMNQYDRPLSLSDFAKKYHVNADYLSRLFKKETGKNFRDLMTECRIEKAKELLERTNYKYFEISSLVGYEDYRHFSQVFKKAVGMTPSEYKHRTG